MNAIERFKSKRRNGSVTFPPFQLMWMDACDLQLITPATHAYCFCFGMHPNVFKHILRACINTTTLLYLVLVYDRYSKNIISEFIDCCREHKGVYDFIDCHGRSLLKMKNDTVHGCCIYLCARSRGAMNQCVLEKAH